MFVSDTAESAADTQALTLVFSTAMDGLAADDITLKSFDGANPGITPGPLTVTGPSEYTLGVDGITVDGLVEVAIRRNGSPPAGSPKLIMVHQGAAVVNFHSLTRDGVPYTGTTTDLTLAFDSPIYGLTVDEITLSSTANANISKETLNGGPQIYTLEVGGITKGGDVS
jgi:hypothetical protein